ncbi:hypothetical protein F5Y15DRAFT_391900 [Xylariaceae sp. FL0016]|nr:hypothetical protein F5Y15DRAFT_391900 [Xylariaceae sp. FL0016]
MSHLSLSCTVSAVCCAMLQLKYDSLATCIPFLSLGRVVAGDLQRAGEHQAVVKIHTMHIGPPLSPLLLIIWR